MLPTTATLNHLYLYVMYWLATCCRCDGNFYHMTPTIRVVTEWSPYTATQTTPTFTQRPSALIPKSIHTTYNHLPLTLPVLIYNQPALTDYLKWYYSQHHIRRLCRYLEGYHHHCILPSSYTHPPTTTPAPSTTTLHHHCTTVPTMLLYTNSLLPRKYHTIVT